MHLSKNDKSQVLEVFPHMEHEYNNMQNIKKYIGLDNWIENTSIYFHEENIYKTISEKNIRKHLEIVHHAANLATIITKIKNKDQEIHETLIKFS